MSTKSKIMTWDDAQKTIAQWKAQGEKVVFTNGCFDILHLGHLEYMEQAQALGNRLVVGLNSDASVKRLKGNDRPINAQDIRARMLAALAFVDAVVVFEEDTPLALIEHLLPSILVKGSDYKIENIVGAETVIKHGGEVKTLTFVDGFSTTSIIEKIKTL